MPLTDTWKSAMPDAPADVYPRADGSVHQGDPADQEQEHAQVEGEAGRLGPGAAPSGCRDWPTGGARGRRARIAASPRPGRRPPRAIPSRRSIASWPSSSGRPNTTGRSGWRGRGTTRAPSGFASVPPRAAIRLGHHRLRVPASSSAIFITSERVPVVPGQGSGR